MAAVTTERTAVQGCRVGASARCGTSPSPRPPPHSAWFADREPATAFPTAPMIRFDRKDTLQHRFARTLMAGATSTPPTHFVPGTAGFTQAIRLGLGWGLRPRGRRGGPTSPPVASSTWPPAGTSTCRCTGSTGAWSRRRWRR